MSILRLTVVVFIGSWFIHEQETALEKCQIYKPQEVGSLTNTAAVLLPLG